MEFFFFGYIMNDIFEDNMKFLKKKNIFESNFIILKIDELSKN